MSEDGAPEEDWSSYDSGPFCRHFSDPSDCDLLCAMCQHRCPRHTCFNPDVGDVACGENDCECQGWKEPE